MKDILKIAKILKIFSVDDLLPYLEHKEIAIKKELNNLEKEHKLIKNENGSYVYIGSQTPIESKLKLNINKDVLLNLKNLNDIDNLDLSKIFYDKKEFNYISLCTPKMKKKILRVFIIFALTENFQYGETHHYLQKLQIENPDYKFNTQWLYRLRRRYYQGGIENLYEEAVFSVISDEMYNEFKELYFTNYSMSIPKIRNLLKEKHPEICPFPTSYMFDKRLHLEFSSKFLQEMKENPQILPTLTETQKYVDNDVWKWQFTNFEEACKLFRNENQLSLVEQSYIEKYMIPYFKNELIHDIKPWRRKQFRTFLTKSVDSNTRNSIMNTFRRILHYKDIQIYRKYTNETTLPYTEQELLEIYKTSKYKFWLVAFGMKIEEINALTYSDIDYENQKLKIDKLINQNKIRVYRSNKVRYLHIPNCIFKELPKAQIGLIFENPEEISEIELKRIRATHINLSCQKNIPINIIGKRMGFGKTQQFTNHFGWAFPKEYDDEIDIFDGLSFGSK